MGASAPCHGAVWAGVLPSAGLHPTVPHLRRSISLTWGLLRPIIRGMRGLCWTMACMVILCGEVPTAKATPLTQPPPKALPAAEEEVTLPDKAIPKDADYLPDGASQPLDDSSDASATPPSVTDPQPGDISARPQGVEDLEQLGKTKTIVSSSGQFSVMGRDTNVCGTIASRAEDVRREILRALRLPKDDKWANSIVIKLEDKAGKVTMGNPVRVSTLILNEKLVYEITVYIGRGIPLEDLYNGITAMSLFELMLRGVNPNGLPDQLSLPPWLMYGIQQAVLWNAKMLDHQLYAALFERDEILKPDEILKSKDPEKELDATSFVAYRASCGALVLCLLNQKEGPESMRNMLKQAVLSAPDARAMLKRHFPQLNLTDTSLHKWWSLQMATMATPPLTESLTIFDTERRLDDILLLVEYDATTRRSAQISIHNIDRVVVLPDLPKQAQKMANDIVHLAHRAFPAYSSIISAYAKLMVLLQTQKPNPVGLKGKLDEIAKLRADMVKVSTRVRDYMDWYEITHGTVKRTASFDSYVRTMQMLNQQSKDVPTPISRYLDDIQALQQLKEKAPLPKGIHR